MGYTTHDIELIAQGAEAATLGVWPRINENHNNTFENTNQLVVTGFPDFATSPALHADTSTYVDYLRWKLDKNLDNQNLVVYIYWKRIATAGTVHAKVTIDGTDSAEVTTSSSSIAFSTITVTPTTATNGREVVLSVKHGTNVNSKAKIESVSCYVVPGSVSHGVKTSGFALVDSTPPAGDRIHTEMMSRILDGAVQVAKDRPSCVFSSLSDYQMTTARAGTTSTSFKTITTFRVPFPDKTERDYNLHIYLNSSSKASGVPVCRLYMNGKQLGSDASGIGWHTFTISGAVNNLQNFQTIPINVQLKTNNASYTSEITTAQITRKPS